MANSKDKKRPTLKYFFAFLSVLFLVYAGTQTIPEYYKLDNDYSSLQHSLKNEWSRTNAKMSGQLSLGHFNVKEQGTIMSLYPIQYHYNAGGQACKATRFEFNENPGYAEIPSNDMRVSNFIKNYCTLSKKTDRVSENIKGAVYDFNCKEFPVFYHPQDVCVSYIEKPANPTEALNRLQSAIDQKGRTIISLLVLAAICAISLIKYTLRLNLVNNRQKRNTQSAGSAYTDKR